MTDLDLERLGDLWRQQPDPKELEELRRAAEAARKRARLAQVVDIVTAIIVAGAVLAMVIANPEFDTLVVGSAAILFLLVSNIRSRRLRQQELRSLSGTAEQMLDQAIERVHAAVKRAKYGLAIIPLGLVVGMVFAVVVERRSGNAIAERIDAQPGLGPLIITIGVVAIAAAFAHVILTIRRSGRELERLTALRESYRQEQDAGPSA
jgi:hypothetical protein